MGLCAVPGTTPTDRLAGNDVIEVGLGIHAEAGEVRKINPASLSLSADIVAHMLEKMLGTVVGHGSAEGETKDQQVLPARLHTQSGERIAVLLNNLGGVSELELLVVIGDVLRELQRRGMEVVRCYRYPSPSLN